MTITPIPRSQVAASTGSTCSSSGRPGDAAVALFGLLVCQHLGTGPGLGTVTDPGRTAQGGPPSPSATAQPGPAPAAGSFLPAPVTSSGGPAVQPPGVDAGAASGADTQDDGTAESAVTAVPPGLLALVTSSVVVPPVLATAATPTGDAEPAGSGSMPQRVGGPDRPAAPGIGTGPTADKTLRTEPHSTASAAPATRGAGQWPETAPTGPVPGPPPAAAPAVFAGSGATAAPVRSASTGSAVIDQVLPAVPRVVLRGDGTSRLTLRLHPADLGEVHLTVTVRGNQVDVTMAAGAQAREALADGSDRLRGLLQDIGHTTGQVVVRDLPGASASVGQQPESPRAQTGAQTAGQQDGRPSGHQHAQPHTHDGSQDLASRRLTPTDGDPAGGAGGMPHGDPSTHLRTGFPRHRPPGSAGLDVTI